MKKKVQKTQQPATTSSGNPESIKTIGSLARGINWYMVGLVAVLALVLIGLRIFRGNTDEFKAKIIPEAIKKVLSDPSVKFTIESVQQKSGVYEFKLNLNGQSYTSYITKDGAILFTSGVVLKDAGKQQAQEQRKTLSCSDLQKADKPMLTAFVVSQCPYGLQMQRVFKRAISENPDLEQYLNIKYIGAIQNGKITAMHGDEEAQENLKQICIREEQKELYWPYVSCYMQEGKTQECLASVGVNTAQLESCVQDPKKGNAYAQKDFDEANKFSIGSSPTLLLNGKQVVSEFDFGGRVPKALQTTVCCGSSQKPGFCAKDLSTAESALAFSVTDDMAQNTGATSGAAGAECAPATPSN